MKNVTLILACFTVIISTSCDEAIIITRDTSHEPLPDTIVFVQQDLFPEGIDFEEKANVYLVSSVTKGTVGTVNDKGEYEVIIDNEKLPTTTGIHIDYPRKRILVAVSDLGLNSKSTAQTVNQLAALAAFDLYTNELIFFTRLDTLIKEGQHLANDVTVDSKGNAYVSDSFFGIIYQVDEEGNGSIYYQDERLAPVPGASPGTFGLNGIDFDPRGYLLVAKFDEGKIYRFPLESPSEYSEMEIPVTLVGADGVTIKNSNENEVVANGFGGPEAAVYTFKSEDLWKTASVQNKFETGAVLPTTATIRKNETYVLFAHLNDLFLNQQSRSEFEIVRVP